MSSQEDYRASQKEMEMILAYAGQAVVGIGRGIGWAFRKGYDLYKASQEAKQNTSLSDEDLERLLATFEIIARQDAE